MNEVTQLFLNRLLVSESAKEALLEWVGALDECDEEPDGTKIATFRLMAAMTRELHTFIEEIDLYEAVFAFQEDPHQQLKPLR